MAETEFEGRTEEEALQRASAALGVTARELDYSVIDEGSGGILGFGARAARIRVRTVAKGTAALAAPAAATPPAAAAPVAAAPVAPAAVAESSDSRRDDNDDDVPGGIVGPAPEKAARALEVATALVQKMGMRADVTVRDDERDIIITITELEGSTDVADILGGSRPPAVPSFQFLLNKIVNRFPDGRKHIVVEAPAVGARLAERRAARPAQQAHAPQHAPVAREPVAPAPPPPLPEDVDPALAMAARALAEKARVLGKVFTIHPMSSADRRAVHATITGVDGVATVSDGDGLYRKIHIVPTVASASADGGKRRRRRRRRRRGGGAEGGPEGTGPVDEAMGDEGGDEGDEPEAATHEGAS